MGTYNAIAETIKSVSKQADSVQSSSKVMQAIQTAATKTGVDFSYLLKKASQESGLDPSAQASTSSASGLFQFTGQTWLHMVKQYGSQYGLGDYASKITADSTGHLSVSDHATKQAILALRKDPQISAEMAGELDKENATALKQSVGGKIGQTELYLAHFLGASGASDFIKTMRSDPGATAAEVLPTAAASNPNVFYSKTGEARSVKQIYQHFAQKFDGNNTVQMASAGISKSARAASYNVAANTPIQTNLAGLYTASTSGSALSSAVSGTGLSASNAVHAPLTGAATMFTAMLIGQMNNSGLTSAPALSAINQADAKKRNAMAVLSDVA